jgi:hypothetical protein
MLRKVPSNRFPLKVCWLLVLGVLLVCQLQPSIPGSSPRILPEVTRPGAASFPVEGSVSAVEVETFPEILLTSAVDVPISTAVGPPLQHSPGKLHSSASGVSIPQLTRPPPSAV